jgi:branched-chain amino acid transport system permease protein
VDDLLTYLVIGLVTGALYAVSASGLVLTYTTSGIFNFAHGAFGMFAAFLYWKLRVENGWPAPVAVIVVLFVVAPLFGAAVERVIMRGLEDVSEVTKLVVTISLLFGVYQGAVALFPPETARRLPPFFSGSSFDLGFYRLTYHEAITIAAAIGTAVGLRFLLFGTRTGLAMRSVVDDRPLAQLNGARPSRSSMAAWAIGAMLAALAGILLAGSQGSLAHIPLTLLVINAYGAAMFGRLRSLPLTFVGAIVLGLAQSLAIGYLDLDTPITSAFGHTFERAFSLNGVRAAIPVVALFIVLLFLKPLKVRAGAQRSTREVVPSPSIWRWVVGTGVLAVVGYGLATAYPGLRTFQIGQGIAIGIVMLSLVPLVGWAGQISLAPMAFAGIGALVMGTWGGEGTIGGLILAVVITAAAGALVALPAIRLRDLYLALATAAFAVAMDALVFSQNALFPNGNLPVGRLDLFGVSFDDDRAYLVLLFTIFGLVATGLVWLRHRRYGRLLLAMKSSDAACVTLGVSLARTKLSVFTLSAAIAGLGGALYGAQLGSVSSTTFQFLQSLPVVLLAVIGGIGAAGGALFGAGAYALTFLILPDLAPSLAPWFALGPALAGISLGKNPNGAVNETARNLRARRAGPTAELDDPIAALAPDYGLDGMDDADRRLLDRELGLDADASYARLQRRRREREVARA